MPAKHLTLGTGSFADGDGRAGSLHAGVLKWSSDRGFQINLEARLCLIRDSNH
jgi:hypothetical protein